MKVMNLNKMIKASIIFALGIVLLSGCSLFQTKPRTVAITTPVPEIVHPPLPDSVNLKEVKWTVYNREKLKELLDKNGPVVLFALDTNNYENLAVNMQAINGLVQQYVEAVIHYRIRLPKILEEQGKEQTQEKLEELAKDEGIDVDDIEVKNE